MMSNPSPDPRKILIIHSGGIGDLFLALPAMRLFRHAFSHATLDMMGHPERLGVVAYDLKAEGIHSVDQAGMAYFYLDDASLPPHLCGFFSSLGLVLAFSRKGGQVLSKNLEKAGAGRVITLPSIPPEGLKVHVSDYLLASSFPILNPTLFFADYNPMKSITDLTFMTRGDKKDVEIFCTVTLGNSPSDVTINLKGPVFINMKDKKGKQFVLTEDYYSLHHPLLRA